MAETPPAGGAASATSGLAALRHRDFRLYFVGKSIGWIAIQMMLVAIGYQIYDWTGELMNLAYIGLAAFAPAIGFALVTGYVADLFDRRVVLAACFVVTGAAAGLFLTLTLAGTERVWPFFLVIVLLGTGRAFAQPASTSLVPNLVPMETFPNAIAWNTSSNKIAQVTGPAIGGLLYIAGPAVVYASAAACFVVAIVFVLMVGAPTPRVGRDPISLRTLLAGVRYVYEKKILLGAISLDLFVVLLGGVTALLPVYAKDILAVGPSGAGFLRSAMAAGGVLSALAMTQFALGRGVGRVLFVSIFVFGAATVVFGLSQLFWLSLVAMAVLGAADMVSVYIRVSLMQIATPDEMRGRVTAVNSVFTGASNEVGEFRAGAMAAVIGAVPTVVVGGAGAILIAAVWWRLFPALARVERLDRPL